eukprot:TRINITY_DN34548_c0_g1_i1.p1 TRINITY_DN34548_c0_g1~~TRINITY_DN34548_c0_g1_i1.p1  ORF type:complete len:504 (+),score=86.16 TRINITY_DN34548_c0_g1_i1:78-1589(+)
MMVAGRYTNHVDEIETAANEDDGFASACKLASSKDQDELDDEVGYKADTLQAEQALEKLPLIRVKIYYFCTFAMYACYHRYLTLYFEDDGMSATQIGTLWSGLRIIQTLTTPFWGVLADRTKRARTIAQVALAACMVPFLTLALPLQQDSSTKFAVRAMSLWFFALTQAPQSALRDSLGMAACGQDPDAWGKARVWGAISWGVMHFALGQLFDWAGFTVLFVSFIVACFMLLGATQVGTPEACGTVKKDISAAQVYDIFARNKLFFLNMVAMGAGFSMVEGMLFLLLQEMEASKLLCGMSVVVTVVFELPIFSNAKKLINLLGTRRMIALGQFAWVVRALFYAWMPAAWLVLLIEPLHGVTFALIWSASTAHVSNPLVNGGGMEATANALLQVAFMGIGPVIGLSLGGVLFDSIGSHAAYAVFACIIGVMGTFYVRFGEDVEEGRSLLSPTAASAVDSTAAGSEPADTTTPSSSPEALGKATFGDEDENESVTFVIEDDNDAL